MGASLSAVAKSIYYRERTHSQITLFYIQRSTDSIVESPLSLPLFGIL